jgi:flagellar protein FliS
MNEAYQKSAYGNSNLASYLEQKTLSASPLELVAMLYSKAISEIREAREHLAARNIALRSKAISKASAAIGELDGSLNMKVGGDLSLRLRGLYRYCLVRLLDANLQQADEPLAEVLGLMMTLLEGWQAIAQAEARNIAQNVAQNMTQNTPWSDPERKNAPVGRWEGMAEATDRSHSWTL